jgi:uncharacterized protein (DUF1778 family)
MATTAQSTTRDARLDFRLSQENKRIIEQAASVTGQSVSDFAIAQLIQAARKAIEESTTTHLSLRDRDLFMQLIESDAQPNQQLKAAAARYRKRRRA